MAVITGEISQGDRCAEVSRRPEECVNFVDKLMGDQISVTVTGYSPCAKRAQRGSDAFERRPHIHHLDEYFAGIRNLQMADIGSYPSGAASSVVWRRV